MLSLWRCPRHVNGKCQRGVEPKPDLCSTWPKLWPEGLKPKSKNNFFFSPLATFIIYLENPMGMHYLVSIFFPSLWLFHPHNYFGQATAQSPKDLHFKFFILDLPLVKHTCLLFFSFQFCFPALLPPPSSRNLHNRTRKWIPASDSSLWIPFPSFILLTVHVEPGHPQCLVPGTFADTHFCIIQKQLFTRLTRQSMNQVPFKTA